MVFNSLLTTAQVCIDITWVFLSIVYLISFSTVYYLNQHKSVIQHIGDTHGAAATDNDQEFAVVDD